MADDKNHENAGADGNRYRAGQGNSARAGENAYSPGGRKKGRNSRQRARRCPSMTSLKFMKGKKAEERAAASGGEKPAPAKTEKPEKAAGGSEKGRRKNRKSPKSPSSRSAWGRPPKEDKDKAAAPKPKAPAQKKQEKAPKEKPGEKAAPTVQAAPAPKEPERPKEAPRRGEEQIVYIKLNELHAFKNHPFEVRDDEEMRTMVSSVNGQGRYPTAIVRPREDGGYEIVSGHRRQKASELAGYADMPCIVRNLTDDEAITQMVEDNLNQREEILPSERAKALKMQLEAIKHQGSRTSGQIDPKDAGKRSNEIVAERNKMAVKQVQRYIRLNELVPDLMKLMDEKKLGFTTAVELSYIGKKNQNYIAVAIDSQQSSPSQAQAKRMRELDEKKLLNGDVIDGIMMEDKKEVDKSDSDGCGTEQILRQGNHAEGNERPDHQAAGRTGRASRKNTKSRRRKPSRKSKPKLRVKMARGLRGAAPRPEALEI